MPGYFRSTINNSSVMKMVEYHEMETSWKKTEKGISKC
jgi:hypothetical protein